MKFIYKNSSANNILSLKKYNNNSNKRLYKTGFAYNRGGKNSSLNKDSTLITKSPGEYIKSIEDININVKDNSLNQVQNFKVYENELNENNENFNSTFPTKKGAKFYYIYKNNNNYIGRNNNNISEESKKHSLYENYKDLIKMNTFSKISNYNTKKMILYPGIIEKLIKLQSVWRGVYVRELMQFYWNLNDFKEILNKILNNHLMKYFTYLINALKNKKHLPNKKVNNRQKFIFIKNNEKENKEIEEYKNALNQKQDDYENFLLF